MIAVFFLILIEKILVNLIYNYIFARFIKNGMIVNTRLSLVKF